LKVHLLFGIGVVVACGGATPSSETPAGGADWKELRLSWDFGPCPNDGRNCHKLLTVSHDGGFIASETPNAPDAEPVRRFAALEPQEIRELHRIVTADFVATLGSLACPGEFDATIRLEIDARKQEIAGCARSPVDNSVRALVALLERHRFAGHSAPPQHPVLPSGAGDPCDVATGCAPGLTCVVSPCVVAPCTSGSCQKL
jgi:hypothetical protein